MKLILTKDQEELLKVGYKIIDKDGSTWSYLPYWFKHGKVIVPEYELHHLDNLPESIKEQIKKLRE